MGDYRQLKAWNSAQELAVATYRVTRGLPGRERYLLGDQMRRAAVSIASNIAEGSGRGTDREFAHFLRIARGSLQELQTQLGIAAELEILNCDAVAELEACAAQTGRLLFGLLRFRSGTQGAGPEAGRKP